MLTDLQVLNGNLDLKFNEYIYEYTVSVDSNVEKLELAYTIQDGCSVNIRENVLEDDNHLVYIDVYNNEKLVTYILDVYKNTSVDVSGINNYMAKLEATTYQEYSFYKVQLLSISIFLILALIFTLMFKKKKY